MLDLAQVHELDDAFLAAVELDSASDYMLALLLETSLARTSVPLSLEPLWAYASVVGWVLNYLYRTSEVMHRFLRHLYQLFSACQSVPPFAPPTPRGGS
jgi:hypothetical protein